MWLTASQALARLGSKRQSLYANVSRGRIRAKPDPADSRRSLYREEDIDRLAARARGRRSTATVASEAISWGDPVLSSAISTVSDGRLYYRGSDAARLSEHATLEDVAQLLWDSPVSLPVEAEATGEPSIAATFLALAAHAASDSSSYRRGRSELRADAARVLAIVANALLGPGEAPLHERLAARLGHPDAATDILNRRTEQRTDALKVLDRSNDVGDAPVGDGPARTGTGDAVVGVQAELVAADIEADIERLVEVRLLFKRGRVPRLGTVEIAHVVDDCPEALNRHESSSSLARFRLARAPSKSWLSCSNWPRTSQ